MDMLIGIFKQLGANETIVYQIAIIIVMFVIAKFLFVNHLQSILETREDKTVKLEGNTEKQFAEITKIQNDYRDKIKTANKSVKSKIESAKAEIAKNEEAKYKLQETEINKYISTSRKEVEAEISGKKDKVLADADSLSTSLIQKITEGL
jgi:F0F1-type ATP synthase membrane subunit b/b'